VNIDPIRNKPKPVEPEHQKLVKFLREWADDADKVLDEDARLFRRSADLLEQLHATITDHRQTVGTGYHYISSRSMHAANMDLWRALESLGSAPTQKAEAKIMETPVTLPRPAMLEDPHSPKS
jgi:hypothetical protein